MYAEITSSEAMIAITALFATVLPNVGPIEVDEKFFVPKSRIEILLRSFCTFSGFSVFVEIW